MIGWSHDVDEEEMADIRRDEDRSDLTENQDEEQDGDDDFG